MEDLIAAEPRGSWPGGGGNRPDDALRGRASPGHSSTCSSAWPVRLARSGTDSAILPPDGVTRWSNMSMAVAVQPLLSARSALPRWPSTIVPTPCRSCSVDRRSSSRALGALSVSQIVSITSCSSGSAHPVRDRSLPGRDATGGRAPSAVVRPDLVEHRLDQLVLDRTGPATSRLAVVDLKRLPDRLFRRGPVEVVDMQVVAVDVGDPSLEKVTKACIGVLADRDQEVGAEIGPVDAAGELVGETARARARGTR